MATVESKYQLRLIKHLEERFPGIVILKNDPVYAQGIPDLLLLFRDRWAALEVKADKFAQTRPNQEYYIRRLGAMSFAAFIYPENEREVLDDLQRALRS